MTEQSGQERIPGPSAALEPTSVVPPMQLLAEQLVAAARSSGMELTGADGWLTGLTKQVLETALQVEMAEHLWVDYPEIPGSGSLPRRSAPISVR